MFLEVFWDIFWDILKVYKFVRYFLKINTTTHRRRQPLPHSLSFPSHFILSLFLPIPPLPVLHHTLRSGWGMWRETGRRGGGKKRGKRKREVKERGGGRRWWQWWVGVMVVGRIRRWCKILFF